MRWCCGSAQHHRSGMNIGAGAFRLPGLYLEAVIDSTQTGPRVRFDISEPSQEGARQRIDCLMAIAASYRSRMVGAPPLRLSDLAPANFLGVGHIGAAHFETFFEVRVLVIRQGISQFGDATLENVIMASRYYCLPPWTRHARNSGSGVVSAQACLKNSGTPFPEAIMVGEPQIVQCGRMVRRHNTPFPLLACKNHHNLTRQWSPCLCHRLSRNAATCCPFCQGVMSGPCRPYTGSTCRRLYTPLQLRESTDSRKRDNDSWLSQ